MVPEAEIVRGLGAYYDVAAEGGYLGNWWISWEMNRPKCKQCRWNTTSVYGALRPSALMGQDPLDIVECPPCVGEVYRSRNYAMNMPPPLTRGSCPQGWIYSPVTTHCYWRNPLQRPMDYVAAKTYCESLNSDPSLGGTAQLLKIEDSAENEWLLANLMWLNGHLSDVWTGLYKPQGTNTFYWADGTVMDRSDFQYWSGPQSATPGSYDVQRDSPTGVCVKYLPHMDPKSGNHKQWIAWECTAAVPFICEWYPYGAPVDFPPSPTTPTSPPQPIIIPPVHPKSKDDGFPIVPVVVAGGAVAGVLLLVLAICFMRAAFKRNAHHNVYLSRNNDMLAAPMAAPEAGKGAPANTPATQSTAEWGGKTAPANTPATQTTAEWGGRRTPSAQSASQWGVPAAGQPTPATTVQWGKGVHIPSTRSNSEWGGQAPANTPATQQSAPEWRATPSPTTQASSEWGRRTPSVMPSTQASDEWGRRAVRTQSTEDAARRASRTQSTENAFKPLPPPA